MHEEAIAPPRQNELLPGAEFNRIGMSALSALTAALRSERPEYQRCTDFAKLAASVRDAALSVLLGRPEGSVTTEDLAAVEGSVAGWFVKEAICRRYSIPCLIIPDRASPFVIGPVSFSHLSDFLAGKRVLLEKAEQHLAYGQLVRAMRERSATWLGEIEIDGCEESRATETANLAVDIALVAVQMVIPINYSREMARVTGRTMPPWTGVVYETEQSTHARNERRDPGFGFSPEAFGMYLAKNRQLLDSVGRRVAACTRGDGRFPGLEQAWSDAAYWFHEGLTEPLDTIAVAKLETALEVALAAESTKGSAKRLEEAFRSFYGRDKNEPINNDSSTTVKQLIEGIVGARSRILHGTFSTLKADTRVTRGQVESFAWHLIREFTVKLDEYSSWDMASDDIATFLNWIYARRDVRRTPDQM